MKAILNFFITFKNFSSKEKFIKIFLDIKKVHKRHGERKKQ